MKTATRRKPGRPSQGTPKGRTVQLFADEAYWASLVSTAKQTTLAKVVSPMIREHLRKMVAELGMDPDEVWAKAERNLGAS
jgi:hypothetical protein